jgi:hypothetical protein
MGINRKPVRFSMQQSISWEIVIPYIAERQKGQKDLLVKTYMLHRETQPEPVHVQASIEGP